MITNKEVTITQIEIVNIKTCLPVSWKIEIVEGEVVYGREIKIKFIDTGKIIPVKVTIVLHSPYVVFKIWFQRGEINLYTTIPIEKAMIK